MKSLSLYPTILLLGISLNELNRYLYANIHSSIVHNRQKAETTHFLHWLMNEKQNVVYAYNRILCSLKKKEILHATCYNIHKPWKLNA